MKKITTMREHHVHKRLLILFQLGIPKPSRDVIDYCCDPERCSEIECDNIFFDMITKAQEERHENLKRMLQEMSQ